MVNQITAGVYQLKVPIPNNPLEATNIYVVQGDKGDTLIDAGWNSDTAFNSLNRQLAEVGIGVSDIAQIIITHAHFDHYGLAGRIKQISGAKIFMHLAEKETFRTRYMVTEAFMQEVEQWFALQGIPAPLLTAVRIPFRGFREPLPAEPDVLLNGDETITSGDFDLKVIWTPGHSPGHICLYAPKQKLLFTGDHVLPNITPNISLIPNSEGNPLGDFLKALAVVKKLEVKTSMPAHGEVFTNLPKRVDEITKHHAARKAEILKALKDGQKTPFELAEMVTWMPEQGGVKYSELAPVAKLSAVSETLAHLRALEVDNKVSILKLGEIVYYSIIC